MLRSGQAGDEVSCGKGTPRLQHSNKFCGLVRGISPPFNFVRSNDLSQVWTAINGYSGIFQKGINKKEYADLNLCLMPSLISTECSQHSRGIRRCGICSLFLDSQTLLPVHPLMYYQFLDGRTAIELIKFLKAYLKFSNCLQPSEFSPPIISLAVLNLPIIWTNLPLPHCANALQPTTLTNKGLMRWQLHKSSSFPRSILERVAGPLTFHLSVS